MTRFMNRLLFFASVGMALSQPIAAADAKAETCADLKSRLSTATTHMNDTIDYLMSGKTDMSSIGQRIEDSHTEANRVLKDINVAISEQQVTLACRNDLQAMVILLQGRYHEVGERIREQINVYSF